MINENICIPVFLCRKNPTCDQIIEYGNLQNFTNSNFQVGKDVKMNIHGKSINWSEPWLVNGETYYYIIYNIIPRCPAGGLTLIISGKSATIKFSS